MLEGLFKVLVVTIGRAMILIGYGVEGMEARKKLGKGGSDGFFSLLLACALCTWLLALIFSSKGNISMTLYAVSAPIAYTIWCIFARNASKRYIAAVKNASTLDDAQEHTSDSV